eukprot:TRINITY_DN897_c0_g1_i1.p1 TRINITY_DN897_c0_g1~~TRINITY_DN897_c0_g1_i1.p1  ORF type:complete len:730 (-),score=163.95 TRINITY_DN897_c0_g1_i1:102-2246(-)
MSLSAPRSRARELTMVPQVMSEFNIKVVEAEFWLEDLLGEKLPTADFALSLRDGTVLCRAIQRISAEHMPSFNPKPADVSEMAQNLALFLSACAALGASSFAPNDLIHKQNMAKVVFCVHSLARLAFRLGIGGSLVLETAPKTTPGRAPRNASALKNLEKGLLSSELRQQILQGKGAPPPASQPAPAAPVVAVAPAVGQSAAPSSPSSHHTESEGYDSGPDTPPESEHGDPSEAKPATVMEDSHDNGALDDHEDDHAAEDDHLAEGQHVDEPSAPDAPVAVPQSAVETPDTAEQTPQVSEISGDTPAATVESSPIATEVDVEAEKKKRFLKNEVHKELVSTERDYVRDLGVIVDIWMRPIQSGALLTPPQIQEVFSVVEMLVPVGKEMLKGFEESNGAVGKVFVQFGDVFKMYSLYCANQETMIMAIPRLKKQNPKFSKFLEKTKTMEECRGLDLFSFLIKPVQRICKYPLLLKEMLRYTSEDDSDFTDLTNAHAKMQRLALEVNERVKKLNNQRRLIEIQSSLEGLEGSLLEASRRFITEGTFKKVCKGAADERHFFLFNDIILYAKPKSSKGTYQWKGTFVINSTLIRPCLSDPTYKDVAFEIVSMEKKKKYIIVTNTADECRRWLSEIDGLMQEQLRNALVRKGVQDRNSTAPPAAGGEMRAWKKRTIEATGSYRLSRTDGQPVDLSVLENVYRTIAGEDRSRQTDSPSPA